MLDGFSDFQMDNITHSLVGLVAAKAGLERLSPGATTICVLAANAPDMDIVTLYGGRWFYLEHHRGVTHSIVGTFIIALLLPTVFYLIERLWGRLRRRESRARFLGLLIVSLVLSASHPFMDWTNNYGVRPFLPWDARWFYGDFVFIIDPWMWLALGGAAFLLTAKTKWRTIAWTIPALALTFALLSFSVERRGLKIPSYFLPLWISAVVVFSFAHFMRAGQRWGSSIALFALALVGLYCVGLSLAHQDALARAQSVARNFAAQHNEMVGRVAAMPTFADPRRWLCVAETDGATYRYEISLTEKTATASDSRVVRYAKPLPCGQDAVARASQDMRAKVFLGFARFPVAQVQTDCLIQTLVQFADLRYTEPGETGRGSFNLNVDIRDAAPAP